MTRAMGLGGPGGQKSENRPQFRCREAKEGNGGVGPALYLSAVHKGGKGGGKKKERTPAVPGNMTRGKIKGGKGKKEGGANSWGRMGPGGKTGGGGNT